VQGGRSSHPAPAEHPAAIASRNGSSKRQERASSRPQKRPNQKSAQGPDRQPAAAPSQKSRSSQAADTLAKIKELVGSNGGRKERTVSTPKQIHKVLQELSDSSGHHTSDGHKSGGSGSQSGVEEVLETLGGS
jgi:hypothetical protein